MLETLQNNLLSPLVLAFVLGIAAKLIRSDLTLPKDLYTSISVYLLFALGLKGGVELTHAHFGEIYLPMLATLGLGILTPLSAYAVLRRWGKFSIADSAGIAAHYGSVSAVTFIAAQQFCTGLHEPVEGYLPTLLTVLECPGIAVALAVGALQSVHAKRTAAVSLGGGMAALGSNVNAADEFSEELAAGGKKAWEVVREVLTGRTMVLLGGGMLVGFLAGERGYEPVRPFFESGFKGALTLFLLEMGLMAGA
ncbi:MAG: sodium-dependent bicarbonate transport family permease, partial [Planctomycetes bacterium]|nr:sodium-dependent bicarbonate transport family permease [Planctomycetota bacterium]